MNLAANRSSLKRIEQLIPPQLSQLLTIWITPQAKALALAVSSFSYRQKKPTPPQMSWIGGAACVKVIANSDRTHR